MFTAHVYSFHLFQISRQIMAKYKENLTQGLKYTMKVRHLLAKME